MSDCTAGAWYWAQRLRAALRDIILCVDQAGSIVMASAFLTTNRQPGWASCQAICAPIKLARERMLAKP